jgi:hypothetical protein
LLALIWILFSLWTFASWWSPPAFLFCRLTRHFRYAIVSMSLFFTSSLIYASFLLLAYSGQCGISSQNFPNLSCQTAQFYGDIIFPMLIWHDSTITSQKTRLLVIEITYSLLAFHLKILSCGSKCQFLSLVISLFKEYYFLLSLCGLCCFSRSRYIYIWQVYNWEF